MEALAPRQQSQTDPTVMGISVRTAETETATTPYYSCGLLLTGLQCDYVQLYVVRTRRCTTQTQLAWYTLLDPTLH